jgi:hypothetical protein
MAKVNLPYSWYESGVDSKLTQIMEGIIEVQQVNNWKDRAQSLYNLLDGVLCDPSNKIKNHAPIRMRMMELWTE